MSTDKLDVMNVRRGITHSGKFHADDVFSTALLRIINPEIEITRTLKIPEDFDGIVYDIGLGRFDHHQEGAEVRENGIPYAAFGLLWREFAADWLIESGDEGDKLLAERDALHYDEKFVAPLDLHDNTGGGHPLADVIGNINPCWDEDDSDAVCDKAFWQAVGLAEEILQNLKRNILAERRARVIIEAARENATDEIVVLDRYLPWKTVLSKSGAGFVVYPSQRGGYSAQHVLQVGSGGEEFHFYFPESWRGKENLAEISGIKTLRFCHNSGFLIAADSLEDCIKACKIALEKGETK